MRVSLSAIAIGAVGIVFSIFGLPTSGGPFTGSPMASPAHAQSQCGGETQRACSVFERPNQPCNRGLRHSRGEGLHPGWCYDDSYERAANTPTRVRLCNLSNVSEIYVAIGYIRHQDGGNSYWNSMGWWGVYSGDCTDVTMPRDRYGNSYYNAAYFMAVGGGLAWEGDGLGFCVNRDDEFDYRDATNMPCHTDNILYGFRQELGRGQLNFVEFDGQ